MKDKTPTEISAKAWLESKTFGLLRRERDRAFAAIPKRVSEHPNYHIGAAAIHILARNECALVTMQILDREFAALAEFIAPVTGIAARLSIIDNFANEAKRELFLRWRGVAWCTSGRTLDDGDKSYLDSEIERRAVRLAENPDTPVSSVPEDRAAARAARWAMLQSWLERSGTAPQQVVPVLAMSCGISYGRIGMWLGAELTLNSRERHKIGNLIGLTAEEVI